MPTNLNDFRWREALPRILADFALVHLSFVLSLVATAEVRMHSEPGLSASELQSTFAQLYVHAFLPLSLLFPAVFLLSGFYTTARTYSVPHKWRRTLVGTLEASLCYLAAHFVVNRADLLPRSATLYFVGFVCMATVGARLLHGRVVLREAARLVDQRAPSQEQEPVLVVGGAGYIGSILCRKLLAGGRRVRVLDNLLYGDAAIRPLLADPRFELQIGDCRSIQSVVSAVNGVSSVVHLAAIVGDPACEQDRQSATEINFAATRMLIEMAKGNGVERLIFASSCSVYGASEILVDEKSQLRPVSLYGQTKVDSERALLEAATAKFHPVILRFATIFGHSQRPRFDLVVNLLTAKAFEEGVITIYNGQQWRPFLHVSDVAEAILLALRAPIAAVSAEVFNVGDSRMNYTLAGVAERIQDEFPNLRVESVDNADLRNYRVAFDKIRNRLGFQGAVTLKDGIREMKRTLEEQTVLDHTSVAYHNQRYLRENAQPRREHALDPLVMAAFARALDEDPAPGSPRRSQQVPRSL